MATDLLMVKAVINNLEVSHREAEAKDLNIINVSFRIINFRGAFQQNRMQYSNSHKPYFQGSQANNYRGRSCGNLENAVMVGPIIRVTMALTNISITHMNNRQNNMAHLVACAAVSIIPLSTVTKENMT